MIFDAHLDLALNAIEWNRDLTKPLDVIRRSEAHLRDKPDRGRGTVCLPEMRRLLGSCLIRKPQPRASQLPFNATRHPLRYCPSST